MSVAIGWLALGWVVVIIGMLAVHVVAPQRTGVLALSQVLEPYLVLTGLLAGAIALLALGGARWPAVIVAVLVVAALIRYVPGWISFPPAADGAPLAVSTWNVEAGPDATARTLAGVGSLEADIVGILELQPDMATALATDPQISAQLPHQVLNMHDTVLGAGLLSRFPITEHTGATDPTYIRAVVQPPGDAPIVVFVVHPMPARFVNFARLPVALDTTRRDAALATLRAMIDADLARGSSVLVIGDLNTTEREPAYVDFSQGLRDSHRDAGVGPGLTWRPDSLKSLPFGLLRIDYAFATPDFQARTSTVDCSLPSDHCRLDTSWQRVQP